MHGDVLTLAVFGVVLLFGCTLAALYEAGVRAGTDRQRADARWARAHRCRAHHPSMPDFEFDFEAGEARSVMPLRYIEDHAHGGFQP